MIESKDITRQAAAAALMVRDARRRVLQSYLAAPLDAVPPELGLDTKLIARVALFSQRREAVYGLACIAFAVLAAGTQLLAESVSGWLVFLIFVSAYLFAGTVLQAYWDRSRFTRLLPLFWAERFSPSAIVDAMPVDLPRWFAEAFSAPHQNLVVFRDGSRPFVGAGEELGTWEVSIDITKGADRDGKKSTPKEFTLEGLYTEVAHALLSKGPSGLSAHDWFYIDGNTARQDRRVVPNINDRPSRFLENSGELDGVPETGAGLRRHQWHLVRLWNDAVCVSVFFRAARVGNSLFIQTRRCLLPPLHESFQIADKASRQLMPELFPYLRRAWGGPIAFFLAMVDELLMRSDANDLLPFDELWYPVSSTGELEPPTRERIEKVYRSSLDSLRRQQEGGWAPNVGTSFSIRERLSDLGSMSSFHLQDVMGCFATIDRLLLNTIEEFLTVRNISTEDFRQRETTILNSGILVTSGDVVAGSIAIGSRSKASTVGLSRSMTNIRRGGQNEG
jgi:hypothetical protein